MTVIGLIIGGLIGLAVGCASVWRSSHPWRMRRERRPCATIPSMQTISENLYDLAAAAARAA